MEKCKRCDSTNLVNKDEYGVYIVECKDCGYRIGKGVISDKND